MRSLPLCTRLGLLLMLAALAVNLIVPEGTARSLSRPDATTFTRQVGEWRGDADRLFPPFVSKVLPTATLMDRIYVNAHGESVEMALVSAARADDAHDPEACLPAMGWTLQNPQSRALDGQAMRSAHARLNGQDMDVLFWWDMPELPATNWLSRLQKFRLGTQGRGTILVRLMTPATPRSEAVLRDFAQHLLPALAAWKQSARHE